MRPTLALLLVLSCGDERFPMRDLPAPLAFTAKLCKPHQVHQCINQEGGICTHPGSEDAACVICDNVEAPCWESPAFAILKTGQPYSPDRVRLCVRQCSECEFHTRGVNTICR